MPDKKVVVVGGGIAGFAAAIAARQRGASVRVFVGGPGSTSLAGGGFYVADELLARGHDVFSTSLSIRERIAALAHAFPNHPYAKVFGGDAEKIVLAANRIAEELRLQASLHADGPGQVAATDLGSFVLTAASASSVLNLRPLEGARVGVFTFDGFDGYDGRDLCATLNQSAAASRCRTTFALVPTDFHIGRDGAAGALGQGRLPAIVWARALDETRGFESFVESAKRACAKEPVDALLVPPMLGVDDREVPGRAAAQLGFPVGEFVAPLGGPQSLRLLGAIESSLTQHGCQVVRRKVARLEPRSAGACVFDDRGDGHDADAVVLCTGKFIGGGMTSDPKGLRESLVALPAYLRGLPMVLPSSRGGPDPAQLFGDDADGRGPGYEAGVGYDASLRPLGADLMPRYPFLFAAGSVLDGVNPAGPGGGLFACAAMGAVAGEHAAERQSL